MKIKHVYSTNKDYWRDGKILDTQYEDTLETTSTTKQTVKGFGGCFNEISWDVLKQVDEDKRKEILDSLFTEEGCNF